MAHRSYGGGLQSALTGFTEPSVVSNIDIYVPVKPTLERGGWGPPLTLFSSPSFYIYIFVHGCLRLIHMYLGTYRPDDTCTAISGALHLGDTQNNYCKYQLCCDWVTR